MSWPWSHTHQAYKNARQNLDNLEPSVLHTVVAEIRTYKECGGLFHPEVYDKYRLEAKSSLVSRLKEEVWEFAQEHQECTDGGHYAFICPFHCHLIPFDLEVTRGDSS